MNIFSTEGRIGRLGYFLWLLSLVFVASLIAALFLGDAGSEASVFIGIPLWILSIFPAVRRLHDLNKPGWIFLWSLMPLVNIGLGLYLLFGEGDDGENEYGPSPEGQKKIQQKLYAALPSKSDGSKLESTSQVSNNPDDDKFYQEAYEELEGGQVNKALWARLFAQSEGDENKAKAQYIQARKEELKNKAEHDAEQSRKAESKRVDRIRAEEDARNEQLRAEKRAKREEMRAKNRAESLSKSLGNYLKSKRYRAALSVAKELASLEPDNQDAKEQLERLPDLVRLEDAHARILQRIRNKKNDEAPFFSIKTWETGIAQLLKSLSLDFETIGDKAAGYKEEIEKLRLFGVHKIQKKRQRTAIVVPVIALVMVMAVGGYSVSKQRKEDSRKKKEEHCVGAFRRAVEERNYSNALHSVQMLEQLKAPYDSKPEMDALSAYLDTKSQINQLIGADRELFEKYGGKDWALASERIDKAALADIPISDSSQLIHEALVLVHDLRGEIDGLNAVESAFSYRWKRSSKLLRNGNPAAFKIFTQEIERIRALTDPNVAMEGWKKLSADVRNQMELMKPRLSVVTDPVGAVIVLTAYNGAVGRKVGVSSWKLINDETYTLTISMFGYKTSTQTITADWCGSKEMRVQLQESRLKPGQDIAIDLGGGVKMEFVWIWALKGWCGKYEVTNEEFRRFRPEHDLKDFQGHSLSGNRQPAVYVNWNDVQEFIKWMKRSCVLPTGFNPILPSKEEWEQVAQFGDRRKYPWGNSWPPKYGNYADSTAKSKFSSWSSTIDGYMDGYAVACPVEKSGRNDWGVYGIGGNVWEWTEEKERNLYVLRGASWFGFGSQDVLSCSGSFEFDASDRDYAVGFRLFLRP